MHFSEYFSFFFFSLLDNDIINESFSYRRTSSDAHNTYYFVVLVDFFWILLANFIQSTYYSRNEQEVGSYLFLNLQAFRCNLENVQN